MHGHLHHVLLVWIWWTVLGHERWVSLNCNGLGTVVGLHSVVWMAWWAVTGMALMISEVAMLLHFHDVTWMVWHLAWVSRLNLHVRMLGLHSVGMHYLLVTLARMLSLDI